MKDPPGEATWPAKRDGPSPSTTVSRQDPPKRCTGAPPLTDMVGDQHRSPRHGAQKTCATSMIICPQRDRQHSESVGAHLPIVAAPTSGSVLNGSLAEPPSVHPHASQTEREAPARDRSPTGVPPRDLFRVPPPISVIRCPAHPMHRRK
jgi:hypothetical protein